MAGWRVRCAAPIAAWQRKCLSCMSRRGAVLLADALACGSPILSRVPLQQPADSRTARLPRSPACSRPPPQPGSMEAALNKSLDDLIAEQRTKKEVRPMAPDLGLPKLQLRAWAPADTSAPHSRRRRRTRAGASARAATRTPRAAPGPAGRAGAAAAARPRCCPSPSGAAASPRRG